MIVLFYYLVGESEEITEDGGAQLCRNTAEWLIVNGLAIGRRGYREERGSKGE